MRDYPLQFDGSDVFDTYRQVRIENCFDMLGETPKQAWKFAASIHRSVPRMKEKIKKIQSLLPERIGLTAWDS